MLLVAQFEEEAQIDLIMIGIEPILRQDSVVCSEDSSERKGIDIRALFCGSDDSVEDRNFYADVLTTDVKGRFGGLAFIGEGRIVF